jgi:dihydroorotate dehydrogenase electron transfer subunit
MLHCDVTNPCWNDTEGTVIENRVLNQHLGVLRLALPDETALLYQQAQPGQFVMLDTADLRFLLRRPFSLLDVTPEGHVLILYKVVGLGTQLISQWEYNQCVKLLGPLGHPFPAVSATEPTLLIAGGVGLAPMIAMIEQVKRQNRADLSAVTLVYGARTEQDLGFPVAELIAMLPQGQVLLSTNDGSVGVSGLVTTALETHDLSRFKRAYICGPTPMMRAVKTLLNTLAPHINVWVSLEEQMPCGIGACGGCAVFHPQGLPSKACLDGPVYPAEQLLW